MHLPARGFRLGARVFRRLQELWQSAGYRVLFDLISWTVAMPFALLLRLIGDVDALELVFTAVLGFACGVGQLFFGVATRLYRGRYRYATFDEVKGLTFAVAAVGIWPVLVSVAEPGLIPQSLGIIASVLALMLMLAGRTLTRTLVERSRSRTPGVRTLIYGAGEAGSQLARQMLYDDRANYQPVGFIDDDALKAPQTVAGLRVLGARADLPRIIATRDVNALVVAIAGITADVLSEVDTICRTHGVQLRVIPSTAELIGVGVRLADITTVSEEDLLGRRPITADEDSIMAFLRGKRILITGAGGSIGSEIARQVRLYSPAFVGMLDRDETLLHDLQLSIDGRGLLISDELILADIRDAERMLDVVTLVRPDIIFHAAALKHLPLLEQHPAEAMKTNVQGTQNVLNAAASGGVRVFVNISTDKAANPTSVLGWSKRETEVRTAQTHPVDIPSDEARYLSVRFGNVLGSRGSVLETFRYQIERGGPVTVTDPDVTRYFMTIPEAVHLVLEAAAIGRHGETLVLDMGEPVRIYNVAKRLIENSGRDIEIVFTGLREGEKLDEELVQGDERVERRAHPQIMHVVNDTVAG